MKQRVIYNPNAGSADLCAELCRKWQADSEIDFQTTTAPRHAEQLAREAVRSGAERLVVAGGDGTVNEAVNGLAADFSACRLGIIPLGTGNDFCRTIYTDLSLETAEHVLARGHTQRADVLRLTGPETRHGLNAVAGGFSAQLASRLKTDLKQWLGSLAYAVEAFNTLRELTPYRLRYRVDGNRWQECEALNLVISNGRTLGGGVPIAPESHPGDGRLVLSIIPSLPPQQLLARLPLILDPARQEIDEFIVREAARVDIESDPPMPFNIDGEVIGEGALSVEVVPRALEICIDPEAEPFRR